MTKVPQVVENHFPSGKLESRHTERSMERSPESVAAGIEMVRFFPKPSFEMA